MLIARTFAVLNLSTSSAITKTVVIAGLETQLVDKYQLTQYIYNGKKEF